MYIENAIFWYMTTFMVDSDTDESSLIAQWFQIFLQNLVNDLKGRNHHKTTYKTTFPVKISV